jgi:2-oxoisovalerate ferredoxin oxidoreductase alpha subunit
LKPRRRTRRRRKRPEETEEGDVMKKVITGNEAAAYACMQSGVQVVAAYPITPQTTVVEKIADFVGQGIFDAQYVKVESEHSAMAASIAASNTGARTFTATSSHGLLLMHEMLHWASAARLPVVMSNVNRANGPPWSVWAEQSDAIAQRDTGWIQFFAENNQEVIDTLIMCYRLCEMEDIMLPAMVNEDAFYLSHTSEIVDIPDKEDVMKFLPTYDPHYKLDPKEPHGFGSLSMPHQWYMELRYNIADPCN